MRIIGLTGGIATGKSTVAQMLRDRGAAIVDADEITRAVQEPGEPALSEIAARFGPEVLLPDGHLDRARLGEVVYADPAARKDLEAITHPRVRDRIAREVAAAMTGGAQLVAVDIPLLFEGGGAEPFEGVLLVYAPAATSMRRLMDRAGFTGDQARQRIDAQLPIEEKRRLATWVIDNSGALADTERQVDAWWSDVVPSA